MSLFPKNKKRRAAYVKMPVPQWLIIANRRLQERIVAKLSHYERQLNPRQKKMALLIFCTAMVCFFTFPVVTALRSKPNNKPRLFKHEAITRPMDSRLDDTLDLELLKQLKKTHNHKKTDSITP
jgi:hypothetical protein